MTPDPQTAAVPSATDGTRRKLGKLFAPASVCIVGASRELHTISGRPLVILLQHGFTGSVYPVNSKHASIGGLTCYPTIADLPEVPDVAVVVVPSPLVPRILDDCGRKGVRNAIVISSGFEEDGSAGAHVAALTKVAGRYGLNVVGPNSEGIWAVPSRAVMTFGSAAMRDSIGEGPISVISQSGSIGGNTARSLQERALGCRYFVSSGNETVLSVADYLDFVVEEGGTKVVLLFIEGLRDGSRFLAAVERAHAARVEIVALKAGSSEAGRAAVASHTGKITTAADVYAHVFRQAGILQVGTIGDLVDAAEVLATPELRLPAALPVAAGSCATRGVAVVAPGATRSVMADEAAALQVPMARFSPSTEAALAQVIPTYGSAKNPVDVTAQVSTSGMFADVLDLMANDPATEALVIQWGNRGVTRSDEVRTIGEGVRERTGKPVLIGFLGERWELDGVMRASFRRSGLACAMTPDDALKQVSWLYRSRELRGRPDRSLTAAGRSPGPEGPPGAGVDRTWEAVAALLADCGFRTPKSVKLDVADGPTTWAARLAESALRYPVVVKAHPDVVLHKTDRGLVALDVAGPDVLATVSRLAAAATDVPFVLVQEMVGPGVEALVAVRDNHDFGPLLTVGIGGSLVEVIDDVQHLALPVGAEELGSAIDRTRLARLFAGARGTPRADRAAFVDATLSLASRYAELHSSIAEIELNPVIVAPAGLGAHVVDAIVSPHPAR